MRIQSLKGLAAAVGLVGTLAVCVGFGITGERPDPSAATYIVRQSTAPTDTTVLWIDADNGRLYTAFGGEWLGLPRTYLFGRGAVGAAGPLNIAGVAANPSDTTTGAEQGYYIPDRARITQISMLSNNSVTTPACTLGVYATRLERKYAWHAQRVSAAGSLADTIAAGDNLCCYIRASAIPIYPNTTTVVVTLRERVEPGT